jgi:NitT/TauT family transport system permease protein
VDRREFAIKVVSPAAFTVALFVIWEVACRGLNIPLTILPAPSDVFGALWTYRKPIIDNSWVTLWTTLAGFLIATVFGLLLGIAVGWHRALYAGIYPVMVGFNSVPKVAVVPVLILWFGIGEVPAVLTAFLISFFPIVVNVATGLATTEPELEDVLRALGASKLDIMRKVGIPRSLPYFFGSLKIAITLAFVGTVISESVASNNGIGNLMLQAQAQFQVPLIFAGLVALAVEGIAMYWLMALLESRMTGWAQRSGFAQN